MISELHDKPFQQTPGFCAHLHLFDTSVILTLCSFFWMGLITLVFNALYGCIFLLVEQGKKVKSVLAKIIVWLFWLFGPSEDQVHLWHFHNWYYTSPDSFLAFLRWICCFLLVPFIEFQVVGQTLSARVWNGSLGRNSLAIL